jgi:hypothetical protein
MKGRNPPSEVKFRSPRSVQVLAEVLSKYLENTISSPYLQQRCTRGVFMLSLLLQGRCENRSGRGQIRSSNPCFRDFFVVLQEVVIGPATIQWNLVSPLSHLRTKTLLPQLRSLPFSAIAEGLEPSISRLGGGCRTLELSSDLATRPYNTKDTGIAKRIIKIV